MIRFAGLWVVIGLLLTSCSTGPSSAPTRTTDNQLLLTNFDRATQVLAVEIKQITVVDTLPADDGSIGYVAFEILGDVLETYKTNTVPNHRVRYRFSQEYNPRWHQQWQPGVRTLAFLTPLQDDILWVFDEAGHFLLTPQLSTQIQQLTVNQ